MASQKQQNGGKEEQDYWLGKLTPNTQRTSPATMTIEDYNKSDPHASNFSKPKIPQKGKPHITQNQKQQETSSPSSPSSSSSCSSNSLKSPSHQFKNYTSLLKNPSKGTIPRNITVPTMESEANLIKNILSSNIAKAGLKHVRSVEVDVNNVYWSGFIEIDLYSELDISEENEIKQQCSEIVLTTVQTAVSEFSCGFTPFLKKGEIHIDPIECTRTHSLIASCRIEIPGPKWLLQSVWYSFRRLTGHDDQLPPEVKSHIEEGKITPLEENDRNRLVSFGKIDHGEEESNEGSENESEASEMSDREREEHKQAYVGKQQDSRKNSNSNDPMNTTDDGVKESEKRKLEQSSQHKRCKIEERSPSPDAKRQKREKSPQGKSVNYEKYHELKVEHAKLKHSAEQSENSIKEKQADISRLENDLSGKKQQLSNMREKQNQLFETNRQNKEEEQNQEEEHFAERRAWIEERNKLQAQLQEQKRELMKHKQKKQYLETKVSRLENNLRDISTNESVMIGLRL